MLFQALYYTGNQSAEAAACYVFDNPDIDIMPPLLATPKQPRAKKVSNKTDRVSDTSSDDEDEEEVFYKMVFVVNSSLNMGVGKLAAQVSICIKFVTNFGNFFC